ncbi:MAG: NYN domain-containing protein [Chloroflexota bacterium]
MSRLAIFIDGGYYSALAEKHYHIRIDFSKFVERIKTEVASKTPDSLDLLRTFYYDCPPYQSSAPTTTESTRYAEKMSFFNYLETLPRVQIRKGILAYRGRNQRREPIFQQKRIDLMLGLDLAEQSTKHLITHLALVAGDSDFCPAIEFAKRESVLAFLFHGPRISPANSSCTFAQDLFACADERCEIDQTFIDIVKRTP